ncbi:MAG: M20 family metallopeptidase [Fusobacterium sp. JB021]|nr:M20 family metallopeptidase [Fusobacterium sp. JB021]MDP0506872.1 M20 family metallopeptidase [Fusobacterium sp. JB019]
MIKHKAKEYKDYVISLRREIHMNPELAWEEKETSKLIERELKKMNIPYEKMAKYGIVGEIIGKSEGKCILLRADMDGIPVEERTGVDYKSKNRGVMHACGHDGHTAQLLGALKILNEMKDKIKGKIRFAFQPAEEVGQGSIKMIQEGVLKGVDSAFTIHLWGDLPVGKVSIEPGPRMASADNFEIRIIGKGGHGSMPHQCIDPIIVGSTIVTTIQSITSREVNPNESVVITVGSFNAGNTHNVISNEANLKGTSRCFNNELRKEVPEKIERIVRNVCDAYRARYIMNYDFYPAPVINDEKCSKIARNSVIKLLGKEGIERLEKVTTAEDFSGYLRKVPGMLAFVGVKNPEKSCIYPHHHPKFNLDEDALEIGTALYAQYAIDYLNN